MFLKCTATAWQALDPIHWPQLAFNHTGFPNTDVTVVVIITVVVTPGGRRGGMGRVGCGPRAGPWHAEWQSAEPHSGGELLGIA